jgi:hypothetical protein
MKKLLLFALLLITAFAGYSDAQVKTTPNTTITRKANDFGYLELSALGGFVTPTGEFGNNYLSSVRSGIDIGYRLNQEVTLYTNLTYTNLKSNITNAPSSTMISAVVGPRYIFTSPKLKSNIFAEGGIGAFILNTPSYVNENLQTISSQSNTNIGFNAGLGGLLSLSKSVDIFVRSKYNLVIREGGTNGFLGTDAGFTFKFQ